MLGQFSDAINKGAERLYYLFILYLQSPTEYLRSNNINKIYSSLREHLKNY